MGGIVEPASGAAPRWGVPCGTVTDECHVPALRYGRDLHFSLDLGRDGRISRDPVRGGHLRHGPGNGLLRQSRMCGSALMEGRLCRLVLLGTVGAVTSVVVSCLRRCCSLCLCAGPAPWRSLPGAEGVAAALLGMTVVSPALLWTPCLLPEHTASRHR